MQIRRNKVVIVGAGMVGSATAFSIITQGLCDDVVLIDLNKDKASAEALDLINSIEYLNRNIKVIDGDYAECGNADIIILTAGAPFIEGQDRLDMLESSVKIMKSIIPPIMKSGFKGIFIVISNPVDIMAYYVYKLSGLPKNQVIGTGTALDSARLKNLIAEIIHVDPRSIQAFTMGEHGNSQMVPWSKVSIGGKNILDIIHDNAKYQDIDLDDLLNKTIRFGFDIIQSKGATNYGIAATTSGIVKAILQDENKIIPVSTLFEGEYGVHGVYAGVPAVLNRFGVKEIVELNLPYNEKLIFIKSIEVLRKYIEKLDVNQNES